MHETPSIVVKQRNVIAPLGVLRYSRAYTLSTEALHSLCCGRGNVRSRLQAIDIEYFCLDREALPDAGDIRANFERLHGLVNRVSPRWDGEGTLQATLATAHYTALEKAAQLVWDIHRELSEFMQRDA
jgi:hypothetical protein